MKKLRELLYSAMQESNAINRNNMLSKIFEHYDNAQIVGTAALTLTLEENLKLFNEAEILRCTARKIKTIGTYYQKLFNGGLPRVLASLLCLWTEMGYNVILYTDLEATEEDYEYPHTVKRIVVPDTSEIYSRCLFWEKSLTENQVDIMIDHNWMSSLLIWDALLTKSLHIPFVLYVHGHFTALYEVGYTYNMLSHKVFALCDMVLSLAECNARFYELCGCNSRLIVNPIAPELLGDIQPASLNSNTILWIGRICDGKRAKDAIEIFETVLKKVPNAELTLVGNGNEHDMGVLHTACIQKKLLDRVHFAGFQINVEPFYQKAAMMLMTSEKEGYPTVVLESKAYGLPIVMYELPYLALTKDQKGIVTVDIGNTKAASDAISDILLNQETKFRLGREARESFKTLAQYNLSAEWEDIFVSLENSLGFKSRSADINVLCPLLDQMKIASEKAALTLLDYKVGNSILKYPRKIYYFMKSCFAKLNDIANQEMD